MKTLIVGLGNPILTDDGVGVKVAYQLDKIIDRSAHPDVTVTEASVGGLRLMETLIGYERVIIVDAFYLGSKSDTPGAIHRMTLEDLRKTSPTQHSTSAHDTSLVTALDTAEKLGYETPAEIIIYAVEVENILEFSEEPTPAVAKAIPEVVQRILDEFAFNTVP
jgi:hydrogenase maturation protease